MMRVRFFAERIEHPEGIVDVLTSQTVKIDPESALG